VKHLRERMSSGVVSVGLVVTMLLGAAGFVLGRGATPTGGGNHTVRVDFWTPQ
jgi:hypothetical protein